MKLIFKMRNFIFISIISVIVLVLGIAAISCDPFAGTCLGASAQQNVEIKTMTPSEFKTALESGSYKLIDIRTSQEYSAGHIANAQQTDFYQSVEFSNYLDNLDKNGKYLIYCRSGNRSSQALAMMKDKGFKNVSDLGGGISAWAGLGYPIEN